jgi:hypothetical protein
MSGFKTFILIILTLALSACETPEQQTARLAQFQGKTVAQIVDVIGPPTLQNETTAVWFHESIHTEYRPYYWPYGYGYGYGYRNGYGYGSRRSTYRLNCTFTATLKDDRVISSSYKGNSCKRFAPKIKVPT